MSKGYKKVRNKITVEKIAKIVCAAKYELRKQQGIKTPKLNDPHYPFHLLEWEDASDFQRNSHIISVLMVLDDLERGQPIFELAWLTEDSFSSEQIHQADFLLRSIVYSLKPFLKT